VVLRPGATLPLSKYGNKLKQVKLWYLQAVPLHYFIGFRLIVGAWRTRYFRLHNLDYYLKIKLLYSYLNSFHFEPFMFRYKS
jgi:hypothetical protein